MVMNFLFFDRDRAETFIVKIKLGYCVEIKSSYDTYKSYEIVKSWITRD